MPAGTSTAKKRTRNAQQHTPERVQENRAEFGRAAAANKLLRATFRTMLLQVADRYISGRLTKRIMRIIQSDPVGERGGRTLSTDMLPMLEGFNFNRHRMLSETLYAPYTVSFDRARGIAAVDIPFFHPAAMVDMPPGVNRYVLVACAAMIDFSKGATAFAQQYTDTIECNGSSTSIHLSLLLPAASPHPVIIALGVFFADEKVFNAMAVVRVLSLRP